MPILNLTEEQVVELAKQLSREQQESLVRSLLLSNWDAWRELSSYAEGRVRLVAKERGRDWDAMTEEERGDFVDDLIHEDR